MAALVGPKHKVNLGAPDKVILIEIYKVGFAPGAIAGGSPILTLLQNHCGMSIVDGPRWEAMKKFNMNELYRIAGEKAAKDRAEARAKDKEGEAGDKDKEGEAKDAEGSVTAEKAGEAEKTGEDGAKVAGE